jgi:hypothetical protein
VLNHYDAWRKSQRIREETARLEWRARTSAADRSNQDRAIGHSSPVLSVGDLMLVKFHKQDQEIVAKTTRTIHRYRDSK